MMGGMNPSAIAQLVMNLLNPYPQTFLFTVIATKRLPATYRSQQAQARRKRGRDLQVCTSRLRMCSPLREGLRLEYLHRYSQ